MKHLQLLTLSLVLSGGVTVFSSCSSKETAKQSSDVETENVAVHSGFGIDKSGDATLQSMIKNVASKFTQYKYPVPGKDYAIDYNLFIPENLDPAQKYPLVLFIADASTVGKDVTAPLTQGYGALVWATEEFQSKNPCYVLVPQFSQVAVNDAYEHSAEVDDVIGLVNSIVTGNQVDKDRLYSTGQSMGGMISMYYDVAYPEMFAASVFVDSHWSPASFADLVKHKFVWFIAGDKGKAYPEMQPVESAAEKAGVSYTYTEWSAKLPMTQQDAMAATMLQKGAPINIFEFETGSVLPDGVEGMDHMYSFDYAYRNTAVQDWLFNQSK
ncbi:MAG: hypothetical protein K2M94_00925 [Paramuribaculum sp.]|nr:hypothetical protein [Paramuribaculum sp.]